MTTTKGWRGVEIHTIGHSTRALDEFISILRSFGIAILADIRTITRSRHNPQFNGDSLGPALAKEGLQYVHLSKLGGLRHARRDSQNFGWRNASFRGFADHMLTEEFEAGLAELRRLAAEGRVALMCAEAVPWRCHRSLVADALTVRGARVEHITAAARSTPHRLTPFARVRGSVVTYPGEAEFETRATVQPPFHLEATVRLLQRRPANLVDLWEEGEYRRAFETSGGLVLTRVFNHGTIDRPRLRISFRPGDVSAESRRSIRQSLRRMLGLQVDPSPLMALGQQEEALRPTTQALRGMRPPRFPELFETFANVVPFQQVSLDAGVAAVRRLVERFGAERELDGRPYHAFPTAATIAEARKPTVQQLGMSRQKIETLRQLAKMIARGELKERTIAAMGTPEALVLLEELPGIGPWSAGLVLLRGFGRLDVFPRGDAGVARGLNALLHPRSPARLESLIEGAGAHRGYLYFCSLGASLLQKGLIHPARP